MGSSTSDFGSVSRLDFNSINRDIAFDFICIIASSGGSYPSRVSSVVGGLVSAGEE